ncbi:dynein light chain Tctex-type 1 [Trichonephila clavipes]|nr:dynein light chain Tctex-type 1 [Trichonephila clavipes]
MDENLNSILSEETTFPVDDVSKIIKSAVEEVIERNTYQHSKVKQWSDKIIEQILTNLKELNKPFKYIVSRSMTQAVIFLEVSITPIRTMLADTARSLD